VRTLGAVLAWWAACAVAWDALVLFLATRFSDRALEQPLLVAASANPIDLARVLLLLQVDRPMLQGYTGAVLERFVGRPGGMVLVAILLIAWVVLPLGVAVRRFSRGDL
jgi:Cu-processing system permease protein